MKQAKHCPLCAIEMHPTAPEIADGRGATRRTFCSRKCAGLSRRVPKRWRGDEMTKTPLPARSCKSCALSFLPRTPNHSFCSPECRVKPCEVCGSPMDRLHKVGLRFCSTECMGVANRGNQHYKMRNGTWTMPAEIRARFSVARTGDGNPRWSGGSPGNGRMHFQKFVSEWVLKHHPICPCGEPSTEAQHVVSRKLFRDMRMSHFGENLLGMCTPCHRRTDGQQLRARRSGKHTDLLHADHLPRSILDQLQRDGCVSRLPPGLDWSPLGNVAEQVLCSEWFEASAQSA